MVKRDEKREGRMEISQRKREARVKHGQRKQI